MLYNPWGLKESDTTWQLNNIKEEGGLPNFIFSFLLHTKPILWSPWPLLSGSQTWHAHLYRFTFVPCIRTIFLPFLSTCQILFILHGFCSYSIYSTTHRIHNDFFLERTLLFIHSLIHPSIFTIDLHVSTTHLNI